MKQVQPNFEKLKQLFFDTFAPQHGAYSAQAYKVGVLLSMQSAKGDFRSHYKKREEFLKDFNDWLNRLDIRSAGTIIDAIVKEGVSIPSWMKNKRFVIDYNEHEALDLIQIKQEAY